LVCIHLYQRIQVNEEKQSPEVFGVLTKRETEVLHFVAEGKTNWEIGKILSLSEFSIKDHVHNLTSKLKATNRTQAVAVAIRNGLIIP
jgi:LuxR family quorum sensing-dependent transcriptional regulator